MKKALIAFSVMAAISAGASQASTIDFSMNNGAALSNGDFVDGAFDFGGGLTGTISTFGGSGTAQVFDTSQPRYPYNLTEDRDLLRPRLLGTGVRNRNLGNALIVNESRRRIDDNAGGGIITFMFDTVVRFTGVTLIDLERNQPVAILADGGYNSGPQSNADNYYSLFETGAPVLTQRLSFIFRGSGAIDNIEVSPVPVPASALLLIGGLGALGMVRRRKKA